LIDLASKWKNAVNKMRKCNTNLYINS